MGKGTDAARLIGNVDHANLIDDFKDQLLIAFLHRLGDKLDIPVSEVDDTGRYLLKFNIIDRVFHFSLEKKQ